MGKEYLILKLEDYENNKKDFPKASSISDLKNKVKDNQEIVYITLNYEYEKSLIKLAYVKKTLTIPSYLDILAKNKNINFSQVLQNALKKRIRNSKLREVKYFSFFFIIQCKNFFKKIVDKNDFI
ncbi:toxin-antitoxin system, antitoxin component, HicB domain protein [Fusobacterium sp. oral taxon 370 str. F0437]|uniref:hypothetical protein n=1 Tax=Fusobacterium sp. oral taxon 370 TaxID=712288 RepID=UPI000234A931|nr:hypothetical protein [Fusobacterium sp. oral taxon 370]EHI75635.1 toxin-antitoxin system, antitoxin component, HicB domain protein [Fusobacterium sp. oral taxon 370 str. F0437]